MTFIRGLLQSWAVDGYEETGEERDTSAWLRLHAHRCIRRAAAVLSSGKAKEAEMKTQTESFSEELVVRELAYREAGDVEVRLLWWPAADELTVTLLDVENGVAFEIPVGKRSPLEVFYHPYAYAPLAAAA
jgi:hypothetical protein